MDDIPAEVAMAQHQIPYAFQVQTCDYLGSHPALVTLLQQQLQERACDSATASRIVLSHGSRRPGGNHPVEAIAHRLRATPAYWSVPPDLETVVTRQVQAGNREILVLPYFLFSGGITDAIAQQNRELEKRFPQATFRVCPPIGSSPALADLLLELIDTTDN
jgi:sirohydrochlorin ferrochelatase